MKTKKQLSKKELEKLLQMSLKLLEQTQKYVSKLEQRIELLNPTSYYAHFSQKHGIPGCSCD